MPVAQAEKTAPGERKGKKPDDIPWLARLTHPLVFFGAVLAVYEGTIGTALPIGKHSDSTVLLAVRFDGGGDPLRFNRTSC